MSALLVHLRDLLALSASSPFWRGEPTGLSSSRQMVFAAFPRSGPPPRFRDYADFAEVVGQLEKTGCIADYTHIWWDIRLHPRFGTIEVRVMDAVTRVEDAVALAAYIQALVKLYSERYDAGQRAAVLPPHPRRPRTSGSPPATGSRRRSWISPPAGGTASPSRSSSAARSATSSRTRASSAPSASSRASARSSRDGNGADRQLRVFNANRDIAEVVSEIADVTEAAARPVAA